MAVASGALGSVIGVATNLYSSEFRAGLENIGDLNTTLVSGVVTAVVAGGTTAGFYRWSIKRRQQLTVTDGTIAIQPGVKDFTDRPIDEKVIGRDLHYLEAKRDSTDLIVFLHGLGLDAFDFRPYMVESRYHCVALTFYGFNDIEKDDDHYGVISLESHMALLAYALDRLHRRSCSSFSGRPRSSMSSATSASISTRSWTRTSLRCSGTPPRSCRSGTSSHPHSSSTTWAG
ncbi:alpha/beta fold hydrolase [Paractinoplanes lichenicola]|uniref:Alpha/beta hydrolase n=1 Tax=Paractinoplanes lichenicola TaxID=2802976 RepID=A0ABS1VVK3_9ACTN|nr:hypothetical protein [Actinoplanes lichenicola]MBL7258516.1 hypothetical protein [Actinoplanes lichenicola]